MIEQYDIGIKLFYQLCDFFCLAAADKVFWIHPLPAGGHNGKYFGPGGQHQLFEF